ncbi:hypothetical protein [Hoeflea sp. TYP-13]|uniref:hypothetical protein n=1 Tax=Hoeflea sp. TYP-13 TaxID=3230023 RepID=UPI0034C631A1
MAKAGKVLDGAEVVRLNAIRRNKQGARAIEHLTKRDDRARVKRLKLADDVAKVGANNRRAALSKSEQREAEERERQADTAVIHAERDLAAAEAALEARKAEREALKVTLTNEELRAAIKETSGKAPHPKTGRDKLIAQYRELGLAA